MGDLGMKAIISRFVVTQVATHLHIFHLMVGIMLAVQLVHLWIVTALDSITSG
jgi:hypothetical protein